MCRVSIVVVSGLLIGCGRVGFDPVTDDGAVAADDTARADMTMTGVPALGLVAWWPLDDDPSDGATDDASGNGHTATCTSCPSRITGRVGNAYQFTTSAQTLLRATDDGSFDGSGGFTIAHWARVASSISTSTVSKAYGTLSGDSYEFGAYTAGIHAFNSGTMPDVDMGPTYASGVWVHIAGTWTPAGVKELFIDGQRQGTWMPRNGAFDSHDVLIGGEQEGSGPVLYYHDGGIDDVVVYSRVLTDLEIAALAAR